MRKDFYYSSFFFIFSFTAFAQVQLQTRPVAEVIDELRSLGKNEEAKKYIELSLENNLIDHDMAYLKLVQLSLVLNQRSLWQSRLKKLASSSLLKSTGLMAELYQAIPKGQTQPLVNLLISAGVFDYRDEAACPFFRLPQRKQRGEFLYKILRENVTKKEVAHKILSELYVRLPETVSEKELALDQHFGTFTQNLSSKDRIKRMEMLMLFGKNEEARSTFANIKNLNKVPKDDRCELLYQDAKIERKQRRYQEALSKLKDLIATCNGDVKQKARYLSLNLKAMTKDIAALSEFDRFVVDYPTHGFSDDVLMFKANLLKDSDQKDAAFLVLDEIIGKFPDGDMLFQAYFMKAFGQAERGKSSDAIATLQNMREKSQANSLERAQAEYWIARLQLFGNLSNFNHLQENNVARSKPALVALATLNYPNVYSWLSLSLLKRIGIDLKLPVMSLTTPHESKLAITSSNFQLKLIEKLIQQGFLKESLILLEDVEVSGNNVETAVDIAKLYQRTGHPAVGYQKLVGCHAKVSTALQEKLPEIFANISYPQAFLDEVTWVNGYVDVPKNLLFAQMRQESGFFPEACSWASAKGLMQLIFSSATEQAKKIGITNLTPEKLYEPKLNLLLGSSILMNYWHRFGHAAMALAAYNAGPQAVRKWQPAGPVDTFIENIGFKETRHYVKSVLGSAFAYARIHGEAGYSLMNFALNLEKK